MDINSVTLIGRMTRDPEMKYTPSGVAYTGFGIAVEGLKREGEQEAEVGFFDVTIFGKGAEFTAQYLDKGSKIGIVGRLQQNRWKDAKSGEGRSRVVIIANSLQALESKVEADARRAKSGQAAPGGAADDGAADDDGEGDYEGFPTS